METFFRYFLLYSFLGFLLEVVFVRLTHNPKRNRKCLLLLPLCPVYGLGAVGVLLLPAPVQGSPVFLFFCGALVATAAEFFMGAFYERVANVQFWDYSHLEWNLGGRVCPLFSACWGALALLFFYGLHPAMVPILGPSPSSLLSVFTFLIFLLDTGLTIFVLRVCGDTAPLYWLRGARRRFGAFLFSPGGPALAEGRAAVSASGQDPTQGLTLFPIPPKSPK